MQNGTELTPAERELEDALGRLHPARPGIDRDELMFRCGQASIRRGGRFWPGFAAVLALCFGLALAIRPAPREVERIVRVAAAPPAETVRRRVPPVPVDLGHWTPPADDGYIRLREKVLARGLDALPTPVVASVVPREDFAREILGEAGLQAPKRVPLLNLTDLFPFGG